MKWLFPFMKSLAGVDSTRAPGFEQHAEIDDFEIVAVQFRDSEGLAIWDMGGLNAGA